MGGKLVEECSPVEGGMSEEHTPLSFKEIFREHLPYYMSIGMSYDEFYNGDCDLALYYRIAEKIRQSKRNSELWLQGLYIYEALCDVAPVLQAFAKKGTKPTPYPKEPYPITEEELRAKEERDAKAQYEKMKKIMSAMAESINSQFENNGEGESMNEQPS